MATDSDSNVHILVEEGDLEFEDPIIATPPNPNAPLFDPFKFRSEEHSNRYLSIIQHRNIIFERSIALGNQGFRLISGEIQRRNWQGYCAILGNGRRELTREFYTNGYKMANEDWPLDRTYVRGKEICFDAKHINKILGLNRGNPAVPYEFDIFMSTTVDPRLILRSLCKSGARWRCTVEGEGVKVDHNELMVYLDPSIDCDLIAQLYDEEA
ncbi:hypothetical protein SESBI_01534 [Sesbania bispinosa]|nr:hypothetical protein SESBI_01534 [Sesbania bispinosa]